MEIIIYIVQLFNFNELKNILIIYMYILNVIYIFSLFIISSPGFLYKQNQNSYILNSAIFLIIFSLTFPFINMLIEGNESCEDTKKIRFRFNNVSKLVELIKSFKKDGGNTIDINQYLGVENSEELQQLQTVLDEQGIDINTIDINTIIDQIQSQTSS